MNAHRSSPDRHWKLAVFPAWVTPFIGALLYFVWFAETTWVQPIYGGIKVFTLLWPLFAAYWILGDGLQHFKSRFVFSRRIVWEGILWGGLISAAILAALWSPMGEAIRSQAGAVREKAEQMGVVGHFILFGLFISVLHSFLEEYYWRWFVFGNLHRFLKSKPLAHALGALGFAAHHVVVTTQFFEGPMGWFFGLSVGVGGWIWSWLMIRHRSLIGAWISHMLVDITLMAVGYWLIFHVAPN